MISTNIFSILFGGLLKIYDDIWDMDNFKNYFSSLSIETIKGLILILLTLISNNDINVPIIIFLGEAMLCLFDKESLNSDFFKAGMIIAFILVLLVLPKSHFNLSATSITLLCMSFGAIFDHLTFPENSSLKKIIWRSLAVIIVILILFISNTLFIKPMFYFSLGYLLVSIFNMTLNEGIDLISKIKVYMFGNNINIDNTSNNTLPSITKLSKPNIKDSSSVINISFIQNYNENIIKKQGDSKNTTKEEIDKSEIKDNEKQSSE